MDEHICNSNQSNAEAPKEAKNEDKKKTKKEEEEEIDYSKYKGCKLQTQFFSVRECEIFIRSNCDRLVKFSF